VFILAKRKHLLPRQLAFLAAYETCGNVAQSCRAAKINRRAHYEWLKSEPAYAEKFEASSEIAADGLEEEARIRATQGLRQYKFDSKGLPIKHPVTGEPYYEYSRSDTLLIFLLKAARPEKYRERVEQRLTGDDGGPVQMTVVEELVHVETITDHTSPAGQQVINHQNGQVAPGTARLPAS